mmetsp:Transcript_9525/g.26324  ORF Transcript_9525/g.26324 Transcript_9525/m.26324 type:complete len:368 (-) Transcript_9525:167-1270(-)
MLALSRLIIIALAGQVPNLAGPKVLRTTGEADKLHPKSKKETFDGVIRVLTWNILSPCYVKKPPPSWVDESSMADWLSYTDWSYREEKIMEVLKSSETDIICLQEVQITGSVCSCLRAKLDDAGYDTFVQDSKGHPVANLIAVSRKVGWKVLFHESRSRAFMLVLQPNDETQPPLFVINVHLQATRRSIDENAQTRFSQVQSLIKRANLAWSRMREKHCPDDACDWAALQEPSLLIMGDFNLSPREALYSLLSKGKWPEDSKHQLPSKVSVLSASSLPLLPLRDVRRHVTERPWTYAATKQIFDYIFVSDNIQTLEHHDYVPPVMFEHKKKGTESSDGPRILWPNKFHPSDHIPIGATLQIDHQQTS